MRCLVGPITFQVDLQSNHLSLIVHHVANRAALAATKVEGPPFCKTHLADRFHTLITVETVTSPTHPYIAAAGNSFTEIECDKNDYSTVPLAIV
jgi:hypothetical protein